MISGTRAATPLRRRAVPAARGGGEGAALAEGPPGQKCEWRRVDEGGGRRVRFRLRARALLCEIWKQGPSASARRELRSQAWWEGGGGIRRLCGNNEEADCLHRGSIFWKASSFKNRLKASHTNFLFESLPPLYDYAIL